MSIFGKPILTGVGKGSASGAVASFSDGAKGLPLRSLVANIEPVQDLHGYDNPWPAGGGVNKFDGQIEQGALVPSTGGKTPNVERYRSTNFIGVKPSTRYRISVNGTATSANIYSYDANKTFLPNVERPYTNDFTTGADTYFIMFFGTNALNSDKVQIEEGSSVTSWTPYSNICPISGRTSAAIYHSGADTSDPDTYTIQLGQTVYGGTLDVTNGVLTVTHAEVDLGTLPWDNRTTYFRARATGLNIKSPGSASTVLDAKCSYYKPSYVNDVSDNIITADNTYLYTRDNAKASLSGGDYASSLTGQQLVYELAAPITIPLTPQEISTLQGVNNVWADSGDSTVEYLKKSLMQIGSTIRPPHYGCVWDQENAQMRRTGLARAITTNTQNFKHSGSVNPNYDNPFDSIYPWSERKLCNISLALYQALQPGDNIKDCVTYWETDDGFSYNDPDGVWVYTPEFWGTSYWIGSQRYFEVSPIELAGYHHYEEQITARWRGTSETRTIDGTNKTILLSKPGMPIVNTVLSTIHTYAKNGGMTLDSVYTLDASLLLYLVEYANYNAQSAIGNGVSDLYDQTTLHPDAAVTAGTMVQFTRLTSAQLADFIAGAIVDFGTASGGAQTAKTYITAVETTSGVTTVTLADAVTITTDTFVSIHGRINIQDAEIGSMSGYLGTNGKSDVYYRGEALWGNMFFYTLGAYKSDTEHVWLAEEGTEDNYDAINTSVHTDTGIILSSTSGYIKVLEWPDKLKTLSACALCTEIGGSSSNPVGDYFYITTGSSRVLMVGGRAINGTRCGPFCWHWAGTASDSYWDYAGRPRLKIPLGV